MRIYLFHLLLFSIIANFNLIGQNQDKFEITIELTDSIISSDDMGIGYQIIVKNCSGHRNYIYQDFINSIVSKDGKTSIINCVLSNEKEFVFLNVLRRMRKTKLRSNEELKILRTLDLNRLCFESKDLENSVFFLKIEYFCPKNKKMYSSGLYSIHWDYQVGL